MILLMALRNIIRNRKNSFVIILLIMVITFLFFIGNTLIGRSEQGLRESFVESITSDVVLQKDGDVTMNLFGANTPVIDEFFTIPVLPVYDLVMEIVSARRGVTGITSQVSGKALLDFAGLREQALLAGVDVDSYFSLFEGIRLEEGRLLEAGEYGAMITTERADRIEKRTGDRPVPGMPLLLTSAGSTGFKIREIPLVGIYRYRNPGQFMNEIILTDPETVRILNSIQTSSSVFEVDEEATGLLDLSLDDLFAESAGSAEDAAFGNAASGSAEEFSVGTLDSFLSGAKEEHASLPVSRSGGDWNFVLLRLGKGVSSGRVIAELNEKLVPLGVRAVNWRMAAGISAILVLLIQTLFNAGVFLVSVAGIIAVVNILLISVFRRTREIGTIRAIGAGDGYIRGLILGENIILALAAGGLGVLGGCWFIRIVNSMGIVVSNPLVASLLGDGTVLQINFLPGIALFSLAVAVILGAAASLYPVETAVRINPIVAVRQG
jgi:ABC-type antimicrobial peptide transport system permease subunit